MKVIFAYLFVASLCIGLADAQEASYFPLDKAGVRGISDFENQWYSKILDRLGEQSLLESKPSRSEKFRFVLIPTWGNPRSVHLSITDGVAKIEGKRLDGQGGYDPGNLVEKTFVKLTELEVKEVRTLYDKLDFFRLNTRDKTKGKDGSEWILEVVDGRKYHVVVRWSPAEYDPDKRQTTGFVNLCKWLHKKAQFKEDAKNKGYLELAR